ncbi:MAG: nucleotide sugar dehydrogenase [Dethiobacter sp.]|jgi:UDP-N-acetyl-D-mannosaminuronic acid dehydrogenase|nr:nucleotide sugar dehydrogenase [Dethiobacter sp.]
MKKICVLGLGYIGLPTAAMFAGNGHIVAGVDVNEDIVAVINNGDIHINEPNLAGRVKEAVAAGKLYAATTPETADAFIISVPTPITAEKRADLSSVCKAAESIVPHLKAGDLVILESTVPPRTTLDILLPILGRSGLCIGDELLVAYCPERVLPGKILEELVNNNRIVGGVDDSSAVAAQNLYASFVRGEIFLTDATTAEMTKLMENTYRDVNIALANEFALISEKAGFNVWDAIYFANKHPRVNIHQPGPGVGGHCIAVDPWFIVESAKGEARLIETARKINDSMPSHVVNLVRQQLQGISDPKIAVLGLTYKANVDDCRESPAVEITARLEQLGYRLGIYDPLAKSKKIVTLAEALRGADLLLLLVNHDDFGFINPSRVARLVRRRSLIDTRRVLDVEAWQKEGFNVTTLGEGIRREDTACSLRDASRVN